MILYSYWSLVVSPTVGVRDTWSFENFQLRNGSKLGNTRNPLRTTTSAEWRPMELVRYSDIKPPVNLKRESETRFSTVIRRILDFVGERRIITYVPRDFF